MAFLALPNSQPKKKRKSYSDLEQVIKYSILSWISMHPEMGFAWNQNQGTAYNVKGGYFKKPSRWAKKGVSDILGVWAGLALFIEVKRPGGRLSPEQKTFLSLAKSHGAIAFVAFSLDEAVSMLSSFPNLVRPK